MPECGFFMITCETCKKELKQSDVRHIKTLKISHFFYFFCLFFPFFSSQKESHKCIDWLNTIVENIEKKTEILKAENTDLVKKNKDLKELYALQGPELDRQIAEYKEKNSNLSKEIESFKVNTQKEIQALQDRGVDKMKVFHGNAETRVKSLWNRAQYDYEHLSKRLTDHLRSYLDNVNELLIDFNSKAENEDLNEGEKENGEKAKGNENGEKDNTNGVQGKEASAQKAVKNQGSGSKVNKTPVALKK